MIRSNLEMPQARDYWGPSLDGISPEEPLRNAAKISPEGPQDRMTLPDAPGGIFSGYAGPPPWTPENSALNLLFDKDQVREMFRAAPGHEKDLTAPGVQLAQNSPLANSSVSDKSVYPSKIPTP